MKLHIVEDHHTGVCPTCGAGFEHREVFNKKQREIIAEIIHVLREGLEGQARDRRILEGYDA